MRVIEMPPPPGALRAAAVDLMICLRRLGPIIDAPTRDSGEDTWAGPAAESCNEALRHCRHDVLAASLAVSREIAVLNEQADALDAVAAAAPR
jgi:hypothetical protein